MAEAPPGSRFDRRRRRNRAALLEAAVTLFQERGLRATKIEDICEAAGVAPRTFFNHFETREHLYREIARQRVEQFATLFDAQREDAAALPERLSRLLAMMGRYVAARPAYRELVGEMLTLSGNGGNAIVRSQALGQAALRFVEAGVSRGEITRRHPPAVLADLLLGAMTVALTNWSAGKDYDLERGLHETAQALLDLFTSEGREPTAR